MQHVSDLVACAALAPLLCFFLPLAVSEAVSLHHALAEDSLNDVSLLRIAACGVATTFAGTAALVRRCPKTFELLWLLALLFALLHVALRETTTVPSTTTLCASSLGIFALPLRCSRTWVLPVAVAATSAVSSSAADAAVIGALGAVAFRGAWLRERMLRSTWLHHAWPPQVLTAVVPVDLDDKLAAEEVPRKSPLARSDGIQAPSHAGQRDPPPPKPLGNQMNLQVDTSGREDGPIERSMSGRPPTLAVPPVSPKALRFAEDCEWMLPELSNLSVDACEGDNRETARPSSEPLMPSMRPESPGMPSIPSSLSRSTSSASRDANAFGQRPSLRPSERFMMYSRSRSRSWSGLSRRHSDGSVYFDPSLTLTYSQSLPSPSLSLRTKIQTADSACQTDVVWKTEGWRCTRCSKPPKPKGAEEPDSSDVPRKAPVPPTASRKRVVALLRHMQGRWTMKNPKNSVADWLKTFDIHGTTVRSSDGTEQQLQICQDLKVSMSGGDMKLDNFGCLHRHGRSGQHLEFVRQELGTSEDDFEFEEDDYEESGQPVQHLASDLGVPST